MKPKFFMSLLFLALIVTVCFAASVSNYREQGGARWVIGGSLDVVSGGELDVESGGSLKIAGTAVTASATELNLIDGAVAVGQVADANTVSAADSLAIPVTHALVQKTTGGDAEALTLADGSPGQILSIVLVTDGNGDGTLTPTTKTGFATIVFADAGDQASLFYVDDTIGWIVLGTSGVSGPPSVTQ